MEIDLTDSVSQRRPRTWIDVTILAGFIFSLVVGVGALILLILSRSADDTAAFSSVFDTIEPEQIVQQLALSQLAGDPGLALTYQAIAAGELDTAAAIALTETDLTGPNRLSLLLRLATEYRAAEDEDMTLLFLQLSQAVATVDPSLEPITRIDSLTQIAQAYVDAEMSEYASDAIDQAARAAKQTPGLLPAHRSQAYEELRQMAIDIDDKALSQKLAELARNPYQESVGIVIEPRLAAIQPLATYSDEMVAGIQHRQVAARMLADRINLTGGQDIEPEIQGLQQALLSEAQLRDIYYREKLSQGLSLEDQYALLLNRRNWSALKLRIAALGFGLSIVPQWEASRSFIEDEFAADATNLNLVAEAISSEFADPVAQQAMKSESVLWLALQSELGLYPGSSATDLNNRVQNAQTELTRLGQTLAVPITYDIEGRPPGYRIVEK